MFGNLLNKFVNIFFKKPKYYKIYSGPLSGKYIFIAPRHGIKKVLGTYERDQVEFLHNKISGGDVCLDVGAHVGYITLAMRNFCGENGAVYAFEPIVENCECIKKSVKKNAYKNVEVYSVALGDKPQQAEAHIFADSGMINLKDSGFVNYENGISGTFYIETFDNFAFKNNINKLDFIKIDVEGYESKVLEGSKISVKKFMPKILLEIHNEENYTKCIGFLNELGYKQIRELSGKPITTTSKFEKITHIYAEN